MHFPSATNIYDRYCYAGQPESFHLFQTRRPRNFFRHPSSSIPRSFTFDPDERQFREKPRTKSRSRLRSRRRMDETNWLISRASDRKGKREEEDRDTSFLDRAFQPIPWPFSLSPFQSIRTLISLSRLSVRSLAHLQIHLSLLYRTLFTHRSVYPFIEYKRSALCSAKNN